MLVAFPAFNSLGPKIVKKHNANPKSKIEYNAIDLRKVKTTVFSMTM